MTRAGGWPYRTYRSYTTYPGCPSCTASPKFVLAAPGEGRYKSPPLLFL